MRWQFWCWLFLGLDSAPGYRQLLNWWLAVHGAMGFAVAYLVPIEVCEAARVILLPMAGLFIGLSFSWVGNAMALLQDETIEEVAKHHPDGVASYLYTFQFAVLIIMVTLIVWGLAGLGVLDLQSARRYSYLCCLGNNALFFCQFDGQGGVASCDGKSRTLARSLCSPRAHVLDDRDNGER